MASGGVGGPGEGGAWPLRPSPSVIDFTVSPPDHLQVFETRSSLASRVRVGGGGVWGRRWRGGTGVGGGAPCIAPPPQLPSELRLGVSRYGGCQMSATSCEDSETGGRGGGTGVGDRGWIGVTSATFDPYRILAELLTGWSSVQSCDGLVCASNSASSARLPFVSFRLSSSF